jgi:hypothetical protein
MSFQPWSSPVLSVRQGSALALRRRVFLFNGPSGWMSEFNRKNPLFGEPVGLDACVFGHSYFRPDTVVAHSTKALAQQDFLAYSFERETWCRYILQKKTIPPGDMVLTAVFAVNGHPRKQKAPPKRGT